MIETTTTYRLVPTSLIHTAGLLNYMQNMFKHGDSMDKLNAMIVMMSGFSDLPAGVILGFLKEDKTKLTWDLDLDSGVATLTYTHMIEEEEEEESDG